MSPSRSSSIYMHMSHYMCMYSMYLCMQMAFLKEQ